MSRYRCPLGSLASSRRDPEEIKRDGWVDENTLVVRADDMRLNFVEREMVRQIGEKLYGNGYARRAGSR